MEVDEAGLPGALRKLAENCDSLYPITCMFHGDEQVLIWDEQSATQLYRIAQEAVHNAVKHAGATTVEVSLELADERVRLSVRDDGCGFAAGIEPGGNGLRIMRHRAHVAHGRLKIESSPGNGTRITCELPQSNG